MYERVKDRIVSLFSQADVIYFFVSFLVSGIILSGLILNKGVFELGDTNFPLRPVGIGSSSAWDYPFFGFNSISSGLPSRSYFALIEMLYLVFKQPAVTQFFLYLILFSVSIIIMQRLVYRYTNNRLVSIISGFIYAFNPWTQYRITTPAMLQAYLLMPLVIFLFVKGLSEKQYIFAALAGAAVFLVLPGLQMCYLLGFIILLFFIIDLLTHLSNAKFYIGYLGLMISATILINGFFFFPFFYSLIIQGSSAVTLVATRFSFSIFFNYGSRHTIANSIRLMGFYYGSNDYGFLLNGLLFIIPILAFAGIVKGLAPVRIRLFLLSLMVAGILMTTPSIFPTGVQWLYNNIPMLRSFTDPDYFVPLLSFSFSVSIGIFLAGAISKFEKWQPRNRNIFLRKKTIKKLLVAAVLLSIVFAVTFGPINGLRDSLVKVNIPEPYYQLYNDTYNSSDRLLFLPPNWVVQTNWAPYAQDGLFGDAVWGYTPVPYIGPTIQEMSLDRSIEYDNYMIEQLQTNGLNAMPLLTRAGVGYIALMKDLQSTPSAPYNASEVQNLSSQLSGLQTILDNSYFTLYKIPENLTVPNVYGTTSLIYAYQNVTLDNMLEVANGDLKTPVYFSGDNPTVDSSMDTQLLNMSSETVSLKTASSESLATNQNASSLSSFDNYAGDTSSVSTNGTYLDRTNNGVADTEGIQPKISYSRPDASTVSVQVNASQPFCLIFSDSYDPSWVATNGSTTFSHFIINGYANGWYVNQTGSFEIELHYLPQSISDFGTLTGISVIIMVIASYIVINRRLIFQRHLKIKL